MWPLLICATAIFSFLAYHWLADEQKLERQRTQDRLQDLQQKVSNQERCTASLAKSIALLTQDQVELRELMQQQSEEAYEYERDETKALLDDSDEKLKALRLEFQRSIVERVDPLVQRVQPIVERLDPLVQRVEQANELMREEMNQCVEDLCRKYAALQSQVQQWRQETDLKLAAVTALAQASRDEVTHATAMQLCQLRDEVRPLLTGFSGKLHCESTQQLHRKEEPRFPPLDPTLSALRMA